VGTEVTDTRSVNHIPSPRVKYPEGSSRAKNILAKIISQSQIFAHFWVNFQSFIRKIFKNPN